MPPPFIFILFPLHNHLTLCEAYHLEEIDTKTVIRERANHNNHNLLCKYVRIQTEYNKNLQSS